MRQKVLITGASGFVGFHLIEKALEKNLDVYAAVRKTSDVKHLHAHSVTYTYPDFSSVDALSKELEEKQYDYIIHAAGVTKAKNQEDYNFVNASYTKNLAEAIVKAVCSVKKLVFISSLAALGPLKHANNEITEHTSPSPVTAYGKSKLLAEEQLAKYQIPLVILRPTAVYGPRDKDIYIILKTFAKGLEPYIGKIDQRLSFVYVKDLAAATVNALFTQSSGAYNITDGYCYNRYEMANITKEFLSKETLKMHLPLQFVKSLAGMLESAYSFTNKTPALNIQKLNELTAVNWCCNIEKARHELSYQPAYNLKQGLQEALLWYKENKWL